MPFESQGNSPTYIYMHIISGFFIFQDMYTHMYRKEKKNR